MPPLSSREQSATPSTVPTSMLSLDGDMLDLRALSGQRFALIESSAYYEAYVHTLKALQARDTKN